MHPSCRQLYPLPGVRGGVFQTSLGHNSQTAFNLRLEAPPSQWRRPSRTDSQVERPIEGKSCQGYLVWLVPYQPRAWPFDRAVEVTPAYEFPPYQCAI